MLGPRWGPGSTDPATALPEVPVNASPYGFLPSVCKRNPAAFPGLFPQLVMETSTPGFCFNRLVYPLCSPSAERAWAGGKEKELGFCAENPWRARTQHGCCLPSDCSASSAQSLCAPQAPWGGAGPHGMVGAGGCELTSPPARPDVSPDTRPPSTPGLPAHRPHLYKHAGTVSWWCQD